MKYEFEQVGEFTREYTIPIDRETFEAKSANVTNEAASSVYLKGFRKGKAPRELIKQRFGKEIESDVVNELVRESCNNVLSDADVAILWAGQPWADTESTDANRIYKLHVETRPEIEVPSLAELEVTQTEVDVSLEDAQLYLNSLREIDADWYSLSGDGISAQYGDRVQFNVVYEDESSDQPEMAVFSSHGVILRASVSDVFEPIVNPNTIPISELLCGCKVGDRIEVPREVIGEDVANYPEFDGLNEICLDVTSIETCDLRLEDELYYSLVCYRHLGLQDLPSVTKLDAMLGYVKDWLQEDVSAGVERLNAMKVRQALVSAASPTLPRRWFNQRYLEHLQSKEGSEYLAVFGQVKFDRYLAELTQESSSNQSSTVTDIVNDGAQDDEKEQLEYESSKFRLDRVDENLKGELQNVAAGLAYAMVSEKLLETTGIEPDREWVNEQVQNAYESIRSQRLAIEDEQKLVDEVYSEAYFQRLQDASINKQIIDQTLSACQVKKEALTLKEFNRTYQKLESEAGVFQSVQVAPIIAKSSEPEADSQIDNELVDASASDQTTDSADRESIEAAKQDTAELGESGQEVMSDTTETESGEGFLRRIFGKKSN